MNVTGFVQTGPFPPGATIAMCPAGHCEIRIRTTLFNNAWWVQYYDGATFHWVGYYPIGTGSTQVPFDLINNNACQTHWYGDGLRSDPDGLDEREHGNGIHGNAAGSTYSREMIVETAPNGGGGFWFPTTAGTGGPLDTACYAIGAMGHRARPDGPFGLTMAVPGGDAPGCNETSVLRCSWSGTEHA